MCIRDSGDLSVVADEDERAGHGGKVAFVEDEGAGVVGAVNGYFASYGVAGAFGVENGHVDDVVTQFGCREGVLLGLSDLFVVDFPEVSSLVGVGADRFEGCLLYTSCKAFSFSTSTQSMKSQRMLSVRMPF